MAWTNTLKEVNIGSESIFTINLAENGSAFNSRDSVQFSTTGIRPKKGEAWNGEPLRDTFFSLRRFSDFQATVSDSTAGAGKLWIDSGVLVINNRYIKTCPGLEITAKTGHNWINTLPSAHDYLAVLYLDYSDLTTITASGSFVWGWHNADNAMPTTTRFWEKPNAIPICGFLISSSYAADTTAYTLLEENLIDLRSWTNCEYVNHDDVVYYVGSGNDDADGLTSGTSLNTIAELMERLPYHVNGDITISLTGNITWTTACMTKLQAMHGSGSIQFDTNAATRTITMDPDCIMDFRNLGKVSLQGAGGALVITDGANASALDAPIKFSNIGELYFGLVTFNAILIVHNLSCIDMSNIGYVLFNSTVTITGCTNTFLKASNVGEIYLNGTFTSDATLNIFIDANDTIINDDVSQNIQLTSCNYFLSGTNCTWKKNSTGGTRWIKNAISGFYLLSNSKIDLAEFDFGTVSGTDDITGQLFNECYGNSFFFEDCMFFYDDGPIITNNYVQIGLTTSCTWTKSSAATDYLFQIGENGYVRCESWIVANNRAAKVYITLSANSVWHHQNTANNCDIQHGAQALDVDCYNHSSIIMKDILNTDGGIQFTGAGALNVNLNHAAYIDDATLLNDV